MSENAEERRRKTMPREFLRLSDIEAFANPAPAQEKRAAGICSTERSDPDVHR